MEISTLTEQIAAKSTELLKLAGDLPETIPTNIAIGAALCFFLGMICLRFSQQILSDSEPRGFIAKNSKPGEISRSEATLRELNSRFGKLVEQINNEQRLLKEELATLTEAFQSVRRQEDSTELLRDLNAQFKSYLTLMREEYCSLRENIDDLGEEIRSGSGSHDLTAVRRKTQEDLQKYRPRIRVDTAN